MKSIGFFLFLLLSVAGCARPVPSSSEKQDKTDVPQTGIHGQVVDRHGKPVAGAWIYAYRNTNSSLRGPADFGAQTAQDGQYFLDMVSGHYYLIARWRKDGGDAGPPRAGDAWALPKKNPILVDEGRVTPVDFRLQGVQAGQPALLRSGSLSQGKTGFTGLLLDADGKPVEGAFALAYSDPDFRRRPDFTSSVVGGDGRFHLYLPAAGRYCLAARMKTRGQPMLGEPYGLLARGEAGCLAIEKNKLIDVGVIRLRPYQR